MKRPEKPTEVVRTDLSVIKSTRQNDKSDVTGVENQ
jgi:hypothetical protein